uniref:Mitochondrial ribosome associated GTPase 1 n=1 Tax=Equus caballus TaxID=9796 RepID=A0A9L0T7T1_HORSE
MRLIPRALCGAARAAWRESFPLGGHAVARWFPGHMAKGLKKMQSSLKLVDCIIEVHDARISFGGCEPGVLHHGHRGPQRGQVLTHQLPAETAPQERKSYQGGRRAWDHQGCDVQNSGRSPQLLGPELHSRTLHFLMAREVCERPLMFLLDTPGVLAPRIESVETGLKLALCGTVLDHLVGEETLADYLLYTLNRHELFGYVQHYGLGEACDDIVSVLKRVAVKLGKTQKVKVLTGTGDVNVIQPNYPAAARDFLRTFRSGLLGPVMLDRDTLQSHPSAGAQGHRPAETDP